jgi:hypothetical protein
VRKSGSPLLKSEGFYAPKSPKMLSTEALQNLFFEAMESALNHHRKREKLQHLRDNSPKSAKHRIKDIMDKTSEEEKAKAIMTFIQKPSVMHSLYDLMFLDRRNHRSGDRNLKNQALLLSGGDSFADTQPLEGDLKSSGEVNLVHDISTKKQSV